MKSAFIVFLLFFAFFIPLRAEVYLLKDFWKKISSDNSSVQNIDGRLRTVLEFESLFKEDIVVNGADGTLDVGLLDMTYGEFIESLRSIRAANVYAGNVNTVINFGKRRYLVYNAGDFSKAVCFAFNFANSKRVPNLPHVIPNPGNGAIHDRVIEFPDRKTIYVTFESVFNAEDAIFNCESQLRSQGFKRIGAGKNNDYAGFFMTADGSKIVLASFNNENRNGFIYYKEAKNIK